MLASVLTAVMGLAAGLSLSRGGTTPTSAAVPIPSQAATSAPRLGTGATSTATSLDDHAFTSPAEAGTSAAVPAPRATGRATVTPGATGRATATTTALPSISASPASAVEAAAAAEVLLLVNQQRVLVGCEPLLMDPRLATAAQEHSEDMENRHYFDHNTPDGVTPWTRMEEAGYPLGAGGENIAQGQPDPITVMAAWMTSPGHRDNILNCGFTNIGIGVAYGTGGPWWTQDFGTPMS